MSTDSESPSPNGSSPPPASERNPAAAPATEADIAGQNVTADAGGGPASNGEGLAPAGSPLPRTAHSEKQTFKVVTNKTARRIAIAARDGTQRELIIPPFATRVVTPDLLSRCKYDEWEQQNLIEIEDQATEDDYHIDIGSVFGGMAALSFLGGGFAQGLFKEVVSPVVIWVAAFAIFVIVMGTIMLAEYTALRNLLGHGVERILNAINLIMVLVIGIGVPTLVIFLWGGSDLFSPWWVQTPGIAAFGRGLQLVFIAIASTLPALLFFIFGRQQVETLRQRFFRDVMMLDPNVLTLDEARTKYDPLVDEIYGSSASRPRLFGPAAPILVSTLLITIGWTLTLLPVGLAGNVERDALHSFFLPAPTALSFGFLGAYFFALNMIFRRYVRADLTPKAYAHITMRILITVILVWVVSVLPAFVAGTASAANPVLLAVAFFVGIFPETGTALVQDFLKRRWFGAIFPSLKEEHPLTNLEGLNLYDRARLLEEGIENIENLYHHNLIELMLRTRIPTPRLVDMFDQAALYLHLGQTAEAIDQARTVLRAYGIRTSTCLEQVYVKLSDDEQAQFVRLLDAPARPDQGEQAVAKLGLILLALEDSEWMPYLRRWRQLRHVSETIRAPEEFYAENLPTPLVINTPS